MSNTFESQLSASARRIRKQSESNLTVPVVVAADNSGHSIVDDGTDYSLLVSL